MVNFDIISPLTGSVLGSVQKTVNKGDSASLIYADVVAEIRAILTNALTATAEMKAYTLVNMTYSYENETVIFSEGITWNELVFKDVTQTGYNIRFRTQWNANRVEFVYQTEDGEQTITGKHTNYKYNESN